MAKASWVQSMRHSAYSSPDHECLHALNSIVVEFAKESRPRRDVYEADRAPRARRPPGFRLVVSGISRDTSWQVWLFPWPFVRPWILATLLAYKVPSTPVLFY